MIRQIIRPDSNRLVLDIPGNFVGHDIEVIAFQVEEGKMSVKPVRKKSVKRQDSKDKFERLIMFVQQHPLRMPKGYKFDRDELYE